MYTNVPKASTPDWTYIRPKKVFELLKMAQSMAQPVYVYGVTGSGKTALVQNYLMKRRYEYYSMCHDDIAEINANEFHTQKRIVVIDDLHSLFEPKKRRAAFETLRQLVNNPNVWLIMLSRCPLPAWLMPLYVERSFVTIAESDLFFTQDMCDEYWEKWSLNPLPETRKRVWELCVGHPLPMRIMALRLNAMKNEHISGEALQKAELETVDAAQGDWRDFLNAHVCDGWPVELVEFVTDMSIVERFDIPTARLISKKSNAGQLIKMAQEMGNFILEFHENEHTFYEMRMPLRMHLQRELFRLCTQSHIDELYYSAGINFEMQDKIPEALGMYEKCRHQEAISRLLMSNVRRYAGSAYYWELRKYYMALSEDVIKGNPELMVGMSLLQSILMNDEESERWYQELKKYTDMQNGNARQMAKAKLLYLDVVLPHRGTRKMTELVKNASAIISQYKHMLPEMSLTNNQPSIMHGGKDFCEWSKHDRELADTMGKLLELLLGSFGKGMVSLALAESIFEKGEDNYEVSMLVQKGRLQAQAGGKAEQLFVGVGILAQLSVMNNGLSDALESVDSFRASIQDDLPHLLNGVDAFKARLLLYAGQISEIAAWMAQAPNEDEAFCTLERYRYIVKARCYLALGKKEKARRLLQQLLLYAQKRQRTYLTIETQILLAITNRRLGDKPWLELLQEAVSLAEEYHFVRVLSQEGAALFRLIKAKELIWSDAAFKRQVLKECEHMALLYPAYLGERQEKNTVLSDKALKVLRLQAEGMSVKQIAVEMRLSEAGVKYYNQETYKKLNVNSQTAAINEARKRKML